MWEKKLIINIVRKKQVCQYIWMIYLQQEGPEEVKKGNKEICKNGRGKENETQAKQNKVFGSKDRQGKEEDISEQVKARNIQRSKK